MSNNVTVSGVSGVLKWGYYIAGTVGAWTITRAETGGWVLAATLTKTDAFRVTQRPLVFQAPHAHGAWTWPITSLQMTGASLTAVLGPKG